MARRKTRITQQELDRKVKLWSIFVPVIVCFITSSTTLALTYLTLQKSDHAPENKPSITPLPVIMETRITNQGVKAGALLSHTGSGTVKEYDRSELAGWEFSKSTKPNAILHQSDLDQLRNFIKSKFDKEKHDALLKHVDKLDKENMTLSEISAIEFREIELHNSSVIGVWFPLIIASFLFVFFVWRFSALSWLKNKYDVGDNLKELRFHE